MSDNTRKRTCKLCKMVLGITMSVAIIGTSAFAQYYEYPYSSKFPNGIENTDISVFTESEIDYPLNTNWESNEEIKFVKENSSNNQLSLSEDAYDGKFSLSVTPNSNEEILIKNTDEFIAGNNLASPTLYQLRSTASTNGINVSTNNERVTVTGVSDGGNKDIFLILYTSDGEVEYLYQKKSDANGSFIFDFPVSESGTYTLRIGNATSEVIEQTFTIDINDYDKIIEDTSKTPSEPVDTKTNIIKLWVKPKYKAESISFYVTGVSNGVEKNIRILGGKDNDGIFKVSSDLALGKWQQITLDLLKLEETPDSTTFKNFYISANESSQWLIDSVTSDYREIEPVYTDLEQFASDNVVYTENGELNFSTKDDGKYNNTSKIVTGRVDVDGKISSVSVDAEFKKISDTTPGTTNERVSYYTIPGYSTGKFSGDHKKLYYNNTLDNNYIYCFDTTNFTTEKVLESSDVIIKVTYTGDKIKTSGGIYDINTGKCILSNISDMKQHLSPNGDIFATKAVYKDYTYFIYVYRYYNGNFELFYETNVSSNVFNVIFSTTGKYFAMCNYGSGVIYEKSDLGYNQIKSFTLDKFERYNAKSISNDGRKMFFGYKDGSIGILTYDIYTSTLSSSSYIHLYQTADGRYLTRQISKQTLSNGQMIVLEYKYYIYDDIIGKAIDLFETDYVYYCSERNQTFKIVDGQLRVIDYNMSTEHNKYLLSFDGRKTWYKYDGTKWQTGSSNPVPTIEEIKKNGMTKEEINKIPEDAFDKIYKNGNEVYTVDFAIGMLGTTDYITPSVKSITVNTIAKEPVDCIYSSKLFSFDKSKYNVIKGIFPVEDFPKSAECYYLLYLGNDWLYTYKDGKVAKLDFKADELLSDISSSWMNIKQNGLSANEVRSIPQSVLTELFVNEKMANTDFGLIAVSKVNDNVTSKYSVDVKLSAKEKYISESGYVLEISLADSQKLIFTPEDISKEEIDIFLNWLGDRQNGNGNVFYRLKTSDNQSFINYYNITNINVYKETENDQ